MKRNCLHRGMAMLLAVCMILTMTGGFAFASDEGANGAGSAIGTSSVGGETGKPEAPTASDAVKAVEAQIQALAVAADAGEAPDANAVKAARAAYDALTDEEKAAFDADTLALLVMLEGALAAVPMAGEAITIKVGGSCYGGDSLAAAVTASGNTSITKLEITAGVVTTADWAYFKAQVSEGSLLFDRLETFTVAPEVTSVADILDESLFPSAIKTVTIPQVIKVGNYAFSFCTSLTSVSLPKATSIGEGAFFYCGALENVSLPAVTTIGSNAFDKCAIMSKLTLPASPPTVADTNAFKDCPIIRDVILVDAAGSELTDDALKAAQEAYDRTDTSITGGTDTDGLWYGWLVNPAAGRITIKVNGTDTPYKGDSLQNAFETSGQSNSGLTKLIITEGCMTTEDWKYLVKSSLNLSYFEILDTVYLVNDLPDALDGSNPSFSRLNTFIVPQAFKVGNYAFSFNNNLITVNLPKATAIGMGAFKKCRNLKSLDLPEVKTLFAEALYYCEGLKTLSLPKVTSFSGEDSLSHIKELTLKLPGSSVPAVTEGFANTYFSNGYIILVDEYGVELTDDALKAAINLYKADKGYNATDNKWYVWMLPAAPEPPKITILVDSDTTPYGGADLKAAVTASGVTARNITTLKITAGEVTTADWAWLYNLTKLTDFTIADGVTGASIPSGNTTSVFPKSIKSVTIPQAITVGDYAFQNCKDLTTVSLPNVTTIKLYAFQYCSSLATVELPKVTNISAWAFEYCTKFATLKLGATVPKDVHISTFRDCPQTNQLVIVDADGNELAGDALAAAQKAYDDVTDRFGNKADDGLWWGWQVREPVADPVASWAATGGGAGQGTLTEALAAVKATGGTVTLLTDAEVRDEKTGYISTLMIDKTFEKAVTLVLDGHTLTGNVGLDGNSTELFTINGSKDGSTVKSPYLYAITSLSGAQLKLKGGTYTCSKIESIEPYAIMLIDATSVDALKDLLAEGYMFESEDEFGVLSEDGDSMVFTGPTVKVIEAPTVAVTGLTLNKPALTLEAGKNETLTATVAPENATNKAVTWISSAPAVATVDENGKVTAVAVGSATITVTTTDGGKTATCAVTVTAVTTKPAPGGKLEAPLDQDKVDGVFGEGNATLETGTNPPKITVDNSITPEKPIEIETDVTIDLGGNTITGKPGQPGLVVGDGGKVTVIGGGTVAGGDNTTGGGGNSINGGTDSEITIGGGVTVEGGNGTTGGNGIQSGGNVTVDNGTVTGGNGSSGNGGDGVDTSGGSGDITIGNNGSAAGGDATGGNGNGGNGTVSGGDTTIGGDVTGGNGSGSGDGGNGATDTDDGNGSITVQPGGDVTGGNGGSSGGDGGDGVQNNGGGNTTIDSNGSATGGTGGSTSSGTGGNGGDGSATTGNGNTEVGGSTTGGTGGSGTIGGSGGNGTTSGSGDTTITGGGSTTGGTGGNGTTTGGNGGGGSTSTGNGSIEVGGGTTGGTGGSGTTGGTGGNGTTTGGDTTVNGGGSSTGGTGGNGTANGGNGGNGVTSGSTTVNGGTTGNGATGGSGGPGVGGGAAPGDSLTTKDGISARVEVVGDAKTEVKFPNPAQTVDAVLTTAEKADKTITEVKVTLKVDDKTANKPADAEKAETIKPVNSIIGAFFDITLLKTIKKNDVEQPPVTLTDIPNNATITITIEIPVGMRGGSNYAVIRVHGGAAQKLTTTKDGNELTFATNKFSTYAIAYEKGATPPPPSGGGGGSVDNSEHEYWMSVIEKIENAKKGDTVKTNAGIYDKMPVSVMDALRKNNKVSLAVTWNGKTITIPAGKAQKNEAGRIYWPLSKLAELYSGTTINAIPETTKFVNPETGGASKRAALRKLPPLTESTMPTAGFGADLADTPDAVRVKSSNTFTIIALMLTAAAVCGGVLVCDCHKNSGEQE